MRLHRHDEIVEAMARVLCNSAWADYDTEFEWVSQYCQKAIWRGRATAALDALLEAVVEKGVGRCAFKQQPIFDGSKPQSLTIFDFPAIILKLEPKP
jgi:hypothetical protein